MLNCGMSEVTAVLLSLPALIWNQHYGWPSFLFHLRDRQTRDAGIKIGRWLQYLVSQLVILNSFLAVLMGSAFFDFRSNFRSSFASVSKSQIQSRWRNLKFRFISSLSMPTFLLFTLQALFAEFKPHSPRPGFATRQDVLRTSIRQDSYNYLQPAEWKSEFAGRPAIFVTDQ